MQQVDGGELELIYNFPVGSVEATASSSSDESHSRLYDIYSSRGHAFIPSVSFSLRQSQTVLAFEKCSYDDSFMRT
jgi:hypothetical protein